MTNLVLSPPATSRWPEPGALRAAAERVGLLVCAEAAWPESDADTTVAPLAGFVESTFSPLVAAVTERVLARRQPSTQASGSAPGSGSAPVPPSASVGDTVTAVVLATGLGDVTTAAHVASAVDNGERVRPLLFFQSVPNAVAGYLAARHRLTGPVVCVAGPDAALASTVLLLADADADEAVVAWAEIAVTDGERDRAAAVVVRSLDRRSGGAA